MFNLPDGQTCWQRFTLTCGRGERIPA